MSSSSEQIEVFLRFCVPYLLMFALFVFNIVSLSSVIITGSFEIPFFLGAIYYWSVYRPTLIPVWFVFISGFALDLITGLPVGISSFIFILVRWVVTDQRLFLANQSFSSVWIGYVLVCIFTNSVRWVLFGLVEGHWVGIFPVLVVIVLGCCIYPFLSVALYLSHRVLPHLSDHYSAVK
ncbi:MAG: hypothetical protein OEY94_06905 [Alphaproteobacteria bacterium]|nr:hypothetical protein [Alphaproteobacteria bacterium]